MIFARFVASVRTARDTALLAAKGVTLEDILESELSKRKAYRSCEHLEFVYYTNNDIVMPTNEEVTASSLM